MMWLASSSARGDSLTWAKTLQEWRKWKLQEWEIYEIKKKHRKTEMEIYKEHRKTCIHTQGIPQREIRPDIPVPEPNFD